MGHFAAMDAGAFITIATGVRSGVEDKEASYNGHSHHASVTRLRHAQMVYVSQHRHGRRRTLYVQSTGGAPRTNGHVCPVQRGSIEHSVTAQL